MFVGVSRSCLKLFLKFEHNFRFLGDFLLLGWACVWYWKSRQFFNFELRKCFALEFVKSISEPKSCDFRIKDSENKKIVYLKIQNNHAVTIIHQHIFINKNSID